MNSHTATPLSLHRRNSLAAHRATPESGRGSFEYGAALVLVEERRAAWQIADRRFRAASAFPRTGTYHTSLARLRDAKHALIEAENHAARYIHG